MIPEMYVEQWRRKAPWQTLAMVEQDLVISRALTALYQQPKVKNSLAFRGGTALNKLFVQSPVRYSEDIDFVQIHAEPIGPTVAAIRTALDPWLGEPKRKLTERSVKLVYRYLAIDQTPAKLKVEINTTEHIHVEPLQHLEFTVDSEWFQGQSKITTYQLNELMATKLRALYQRRKGRDLFDLWYALEKDLIDCSKVLNIFAHYCHHNQEPISRAMFEQNLLAKRQHIDFSTDIIPLLTAEISWHFENALNRVEKQLISQLQ